MGIEVLAMKPIFLCRSFLKDEVLCAIWSLVCLLSLLARFSSFSFAFFALRALILLDFFFFGFAFFRCSRVGCQQCCSGCSSGYCSEYSLEHGREYSSCCFFGVSLRYWFGCSSECLFASSECFGVSFFVC